MSNEIEVYPSPEPVQEARRIIADALRDQGLRKVQAMSMGKEMSYKDYLAIMLWDLVVDGVAHFANGHTIEIEDYGDWLSTVKYISSHLDGSASRDIGVGINIFKVYQGVDVDRV